MPVIEEKLPERVEKVREEKITLDLETASLSDVIKYNKKIKERNKKEKNKKQKNK